MMSLLVGMVWYIHIWHSLQRNEMHTDALLALKMHSNILQCYAHLKINEYLSLQWRSNTNWLFLLTVR